MKIKNIQLPWRIISDYSIEYLEENSVKIEISLGNIQYERVYTFDEVYPLSGPDETIFHKNLMDYFVIDLFASGNRTSEICDYISHMFNNPYDMISIEQTLIRRACNEHTVKH